MANYPIEKYNIVVHQHPDYLSTEIIAYSTYAGQTVKGKAIWRVEDVYNENSGIRLAVARCAEKIARKRRTNANRKLNEAKIQYEAATKHLKDMEKYYEDACVEVDETKAEVENLLKEF